MLLNNMRQLMSNQSASSRLTGCELSSTEDYMLANSERVCMNRSRRTRGGRIVMQPHAAEVAPETRLHGSSRTFIERMTRTLQYLMHDLWNSTPLSVPAAARALQCSLTFSSALLALPTTMGLASASALALQRHRSGQLLCRRLMLHGGSGGRERFH